MPYKSKFCARCGQKSTDSRISLRRLLKEVWFRVLHLESRSLRFMLLLFIPGYVTQEFFSGRQKRYPQPIRFFFIVAFLFLFTLNHLVNFGGLQATQSENGVNIQGKPKSEQGNYDFYELGKRFAEYEILQQEFDSLPEEYRTPFVRKAVDSLLHRNYGEAIQKFEWMLARADSSKRGNMDSITLKLGMDTIQLATIDAFRLDPDTIIAKYKVKGWFDQSALRQGLKTLKDPAALMKTYIGSLGWTILALVGLMSVILTFLYWRQKRFYVEHFIFLLNEHSSMFLLLIAALWINELAPLGLFWLLPAAWILVSPFLGMKRFYAQSWGITILKSLVFSIAYVVGFILLFTAGILVVFMIF